MLTTKAEFGWWDSGTLVCTNYRLLWFPSRFAEAAKFEIQLRDVISCMQVRSPKYLFLQPSLKIVLRTGMSYELHNMKDINEVQKIVVQNMGRERYQPGSLFRD